MRRYNIVSGILLILSMIDFTLAAPVLVQEKRQTFVDAVHVLPKDVITVLGKRGEEDMWEEYINILENLESSSSSSLSEPHHESTNVVQPPSRPNSGSSTANPNPPLVEPASSSYKGYDESDWPQYTPTSSGYSSDREFTEAHASALQPNHPRPSTDSDSDSDSSTDPGPPDFDWGYWMNPEDPPRPRPPNLLGSPLKEPDDEVDSQPVDPSLQGAAKGNAKESIPP
ncbi:hypothetical protein F5888DRAFT_964567 [Russula emetica]|nr:hypothetical protein F5888DRAFT_964567 [Russula emetica]